MERKCENIASEFHCPWLIVVMLIVGASVMILPGRAWAGDTYMRIVVVNHDAQEGVYVEYDNSVCTSWKYVNPDRTIPRLGTKEIYGLYRASNCRGKNGDFDLVVKYRPGGESASLHVSFTADHGLETTNVRNAARTVLSTEYAVGYKGDDDDRLTLNVYDPLRVPWADRFAGGCYRTEELDRELAKFASRSDIGSIANQYLNVESYKAGSTATRFVIDSFLWGFRATGRSSEVDALESLATRSYYDIDAEGKIASLFASRNGVPFTDETQLAYQLLAIRSSREPRSQFSSIALDYQTAAAFAQPGWYVYAFEFSPRSRLFGLKSCDASSGGELQFQSPNGTPIQDLYRRLPEGNSRWQEWQNNQWVDTTTVPSN